MVNGKTVKSVDKKVTCPTCNKTLARKYSLDRHIARFHAAVQESIVKSEQLEDLQEIPIVKSEQLGDLVRDTEYSKIRTIRRPARDTEYSKIGSKRRPARFSR